MANNKTSSEKTEQKTPNTKVRTNVLDGFQAVLRWLDYNILPLIALPILAVLAADDIKGHLAHVSANAALAIGIAFAAILAVKSHK